MLKNIQKNKYGCDMELLKPSENKLAVSERKNPMCNERYSINKDTIREIVNSSPGPSRGTC